MYFYGWLSETQEGICEPNFENDIANDDTVTPRFYCSLLTSSKFPRSFIHRFFELEYLNTATITQYIDNTILKVHRSAIQSLCNWEKYRSCLDTISLAGRFQHPSESLTTWIEASLFFSRSYFIWWCDKKSSAAVVQDRVFNAKTGMRYDRYGDPSDSSCAIISRCLREIPRLPLTSY